MPEESEVGEPQLPPLEDVPETAAETVAENEYYALRGWQVTYASTHKIVFSNGMSLVVKNGVIVPE